MTIFTQTALAQNDTATEVIGAEGIELAATPEQLRTEAQTTQVRFADLGVPAILGAQLSKIKYEFATPIQEQAIPFGLQGRDILGSAQTGTGKTAAFTIPMIAHLLAHTENKALILAPTRELATQIMQTITQMTDHSWRMRCALLIGGDSMTRQLHALQQNPRIIIGTPGRINDHLARRSLNLSKAHFLVLDETDRMLDMGFGVQIDKVLSFMPAQRQTLLFSATLPAHITKLSERYLKNPQRIAVGSTTTPIAKIKQETLEVAQPQKYEALTAELDRRAGSVIVFVRTKHGADRLTNKLSRENHSATAIHGDLRQNQRDKAIRKFREGSIRILVATDVAARGLDVPHIEHVINYDLPQCPEDYIHRIGRTGRNGAEGQAMAFISPEERVKWNAIQALLNPSERKGRGPGHAPDRSQRGDKNPRKNPGKARSRHQRRDWKGPNRHRDENGHNSRDQEPRTPRNAARFKERGHARHENRNEHRNEKRGEYRNDLVRVRERDDNVWDNQSASGNRSDRAPKRHDIRHDTRPERSYDRDKNRRTEGERNQKPRSFKSKGRPDNRGERPNRSEAPRRHSFGSGGPSGFKGPKRQSAA